RREQRLRKFQRNNNALFQLKKCSNLCHSPSNQTGVQLKDNQPLEIGQLFPDQYGDHDQDGIVEKEARDDEISRLRPFRLLGKSPYLIQMIMMISLSKNVIRLIKVF
ncbi:hypothetical protein MS3_00000695, partial [Schistosoma haematobium]